jgi:hypothetical protein
MSKTIYVDGEYMRNNPTWHVEDSAWKAEQVMRMIDRHRLNPRSVCEVGCGAGEILAQLHEKMTAEIEFTGYEISPQAFLLCQQREKDRLNYHLKNILDEKNAFFDVILVMDVMEHIENYIDFLRGIRAKGTYKIFHIPLDLFVLSAMRVSPILERRERVGHIHYFMKETALAALKDIGYEIVDMFYTACDADFQVKFIKSRILNFARKIFFKVHQDLTVRFLGGYSLMVLTK